MQKYSIGIDVGGTNVKIGLVNSDGKVIVKNRVSTQEFSSSKSMLVNKLVLCIEEILDDSGVELKNIQGIGFGFPGLVDYQRGIVRILTNVPGWKDVAIKRIFEKKFGVPVFVDNDVNVITLGEWKFGAAKGYGNIVCFTLGTGVGGGLILDNKLYRGEGFVAGEIGHIPINEKGPNCNCGGTGCFEAYVGNRKLLADAMKIFKNKKLELTDVYDLAVNGNVRAVEFWQKMAEHIGNALVGVINLLNPRLIVVGGGVGNAYDLIYPTIISVIKSRAMKIPASMVKIVKAKLSDDAGIIGAHVLITESLGGK